MSATLLEQWRNIAYDQSASNAQMQNFWGSYFVIEKEIYEQLLVIMDVHPIQKGRAKIVLDEVDLKLLKAYTAKNVYWDFAVTANKILTPRFKALMIEHWGEEFFNEKKGYF